MKKILSLGLFIIICCSFMVGCSNKMSIDEIDKYEEQENNIKSDLNTSSEILKSIITYSDIIWAVDDQKEIDELYKKMLGKQDLIKETEDDLDRVSLNKLLKFHNYMVEYKGTTQEKEDNEFISINYQYLLAKRRLAYSKEIISLYDDGTLSEEEYKKIENINYLSNNYLNDDFKKDIKALQDKLDEKYSLDSKTLRELSDKLNKIVEEN